MTPVSTIVLILECLSLVALCIGLLSYSQLIASHMAFFSSLHHAGKETRMTRVRFLFWTYLLSTLLLVLLTSAFYIWQPVFF